MHLRYCQMKPEEAQSHAGRRSEKAAYERKLDERQKSLPEAKCCGEALDNVYRFKYLGSIFTADGSHEFDVRRREGMAMTPRL